MKIIKAIKQICSIIIWTITIHTFQSCGNSDRSRLELIEEESDYKFTQAINTFLKYRTEINTDSLTTIYKTISSKNIEDGYDYAEKLYNTSLTIKDSIALFKKSEITKQNAEKQKEWYKTKPGKIQKKHPEWTREECENLAGRKIWIGMSLDMLKYLRGNPNRANPSNYGNYGNGVHWQWCWDDYSPSCFYGGEDGIITSYN